MYLHFIEDAEDDDTDHNADDDEVLLPAQLFFEENAGEDDGEHAVAGDHGRGDDGVIRNGVNIEELAGRFAQGAQALLLLLPQAEFLLFHAYQEKEGKHRAQQEDQLIGGIRLELGGFAVHALHIFQHDGIRKGAEPVNDAV